MKSLWLTLLLAVLVGCASTQSGPRLKPFGAHFDPTVDLKGPALCLVNHTGQDLHEVKLSIYIVSNSGQSMLHPYGEVTQWPREQEIMLRDLPSKRVIVFPRWCREVRLVGTCKEGRIKETFRTNY